MNNKLENRHYSFSELMHEGFKEKGAVTRAKTSAYLGAFNILNGIVNIQHPESGLIYAGIGVALIASAVNATIGDGRERLRKNE